MSDFSLIVKTHQFVNKMFHFWSHITQTTEIRPDNTAAAEASTAAPSGVVVVVVVTAAGWGPATVVVDAL